MFSASPVLYANASVVTSTLIPIVRAIPTGSADSAINSVVSPTGTEVIL